MTAASASPVTDSSRRWTFHVTPALELSVLAGAIAMAFVSYFIIVSGSSPVLLTPPMVALLLVANLVPGIALLVLLGRRIAMRRAALSPVGGRGKLHVRLVALFSVIAAVPTLLVVIFASVLFQFGVEFWFSDRARGMLENAAVLARENYDNELGQVDRNVVTMTGDLREYLQTLPIDSPRFAQGLAYQIYRRELSEALIIDAPRNQPMTYPALVNPYERDLTKVVTPPMIAALRSGKRSVVVGGGDRIGVVTTLDPGAHTFVYAARVYDPQFAAQVRRGKAILGDYQALLTRSRSLQLRFNAALLGISLLIVAIAVWIALAVADRLVRPVGELVAAARRVETGDLSARVPVPKTDDEVGVLANAFNEMTGRIEAQTSALDSRRALIEAVMSGVTAGVISIGRDGTIRLINRSAATLLKTGDDNPVGRPLSLISPELDALIASEDREAIVEVDAAGEAKTLAVKITRAVEGPILTFDDITGQLLDQRRAAWSDVARRIAHEIKNPLTPIQLAAERLQRRYGKQIAADDGTFAKLTDTIIRQVGDLRRMVDEFSSFARMPKPIFRSESLLDLARQTLFLHEVAHPQIRFVLQYDEPGPALVCDRRQIGQALTNIIKNAVEAIEAKGEGTEGGVAMTLWQDAESASIVVRDSGIGLPANRDRIVEPYVTTRARGTGLGLAIVKKIVEEHFGTITFADNEGGGTCVTIRFDTQALAALDSGEAPPNDAHAPEHLQNRT